VHSAALGRGRGLDVRALQLTGPIAFHGEGPFWDATRGRLLIMDMLEGAVLSLDDDGVHSHPIGSIAAVVRARAGGGYVAAVERGFALLDDSLSVQQLLPEIFDDHAIRLNEGGCDPQGRFYCGSMAYAQTPGAGALYRLDADRRVSTVLEGVTISNGLQWSADGSRAFYNDTPTGRIDVFDFDGDTAAFTHRRPFVDLADGLNPDGMAIDDEDGVWIALWGGSAVHRYDADGRLDQVVELPVTNVTACAFGGDDRRTLYITTSRQHLEPGTQPDAGSVYAVDVGITGAVPFAWAG
jgi:sugar lactone lactonase YvrE